MNLDSQKQVTQVLNHNDYYQDRRMKRFFNKNYPLNDNSDSRNMKNNKSKKNFYSYVDHTIIDNERRTNNYIDSDSFSYKCLNGGIQTKTPSYSIDRNPLLNPTLNKYSNHVNNGIKRSPKPKDTSDITKVRYISHNQWDDNRTTRYQKDKPFTSKKFNFLQESQLNFDKFDSLSNNTKDTSVSIDSSLSSLKTSNNALNPAAVEFTPTSLTLTPVSLSSTKNFKSTKKIVDSIEDEFKSLSLGNENVMHTISNPVVIDSSELNFTYPQLAMLSTEHNNLAKLGFVEPQSLIQNVCQYPSGSNGRSLSGLSYSNTPQIIPQFQVALYGTLPQLVPRYNPIAHNVPVNFQGGYLVYNPVMFNGMYNQYFSTPLLTNRLVPLGSADIAAGTTLATHNIAHQFNANVTPAAYPPYYTDSMNSYVSHIR